MKTGDMSLPEFVQELFKEAAAALVAERDAEWQRAWNGLDVARDFGPKTPEELRTFRVNAEVREHMARKAGHGVIDDSFLGTRGSCRPLDENEREFATCAVCDRKSVDRGECLRMHDREHAVIGPPPHWFFAHAPKGIGHVLLCSEKCASFYLDVVCCPKACQEQDGCEYEHAKWQGRAGGAKALENLDTRTAPESPCDAFTTRTAPESPCTCAEIQRKDPLRHFRECPLREDLPPGHPQAEPLGKCSFLDDVEKSRKLFEVLQEIGHPHPIQAVYDLLLAEKARKPDGVL